VHAIGLNSWTGTEGSPVSSLHMSPSHINFHSLGDNMLQLGNTFVA